MKDRIADEIARSDLSTQIAVAITDAIATYQKTRLRFNQTFTGSFNTVVGQQYYSTVTDASFSNVAGLQQFYQIDWMLYAIGAANFVVERTDMQRLLLLSQTGTQMGQPYNYAYENETIALYPNPSGVFAVTVSGHVTYIAPAGDDTANNRWMTDGERLIRSRAKFNLAKHVTGDQQMQAEMSPYVEGGEAYEAERELTIEMNRMKRRGMVRAVSF